MEKLDQVIKQLSKLVNVVQEVVDHRNAPRSTVNRAAQK